MNISSKPKIVVLADWYLPGTKAGGPVRSIYSLIELIKDYFDLYVITTNTDLGTDKPYENIQSNVLFEKDGVNYFYFSKDELNAARIIKQINEIHPKLVYLNSFWSYLFSIRIVQAKQSGEITSPVLLAPRGMLSKGAMSLKALKKKTFLLLAKISGKYKNLHFHATNEQERQDILRQFRKAKVFVVQNINAGRPLVVEKEKKENHLRLFYLSRIARVKNLHFALEILAQLPSSVQIEYDIFGNLEDKSYWNECQALIKTLPENIKVHYKGEISFQDVQQKIAEYHALFLPTLNENFGHSIVESLLSGCPAIISDQTPWNDLENFNAGYTFALNNKKSFVQALTRLAEMDSNEYKIKSKAAIEYISNKLNINQILQQYRNMFYDTTKN